MNDNLTPRERVRKALAHEKPDRIPIGYYSTPETEANLKKYLGIANNNKLFKRLGVDCRMVFPDYIGPKDLSGHFGILEGGKDVWGVQYGTVSNFYGGYYEILNYPLKDVKSVDELEEYPWPKIEWFDFDSVLRQIENLEKEDEYWIVLFFGGSVFEYSWYMRGMDKFIMDLVINPDIANKIMEKVSDHWIAFTIETLKAAKGRIDMVRTGDDIAGQENMLTSPQLWRKMIKPWFKKFFSVYHNFGVKTLYHSDGSVAPEVIEELIEIGCDVLNPLQFSAKKFPSKEELRDKFGGRLCFNGGMDVQTILPFGTIEEVRKESMELINVLGENGGLIFESSHALQPDIPPENIMAMYDTALNFRY